MTEKKRNSKSWKAEAGKLEQLLVAACEELTTQRHVEETGEVVASDIENVADVALWWEEHQDASTARQAELKLSGIAKLSAAERRALGFAP